MAGFSTDTFKISVAESRGILGVDESSTKYSISVTSNTVLIKNCQAKILGESFTPWNELTSPILQEPFAPNSQPEVADACDVSRVESELIDLDYLYGSESSSEGGDFEVAESQDPGPLANTLKLLEEISYRVLGEKKSSIPKIEKIEINSSEDEEEMSVEKTGEEVEEEEKVSPKCIEYLDLVPYSVQFVDSILHKAKQVCKYQHDQKVVAVTFGQDDKEHTITWPTIEKFTIEAAIHCVDKYINRCFILVETWKHKITHLISQSDKMSDFHFFEAKFCIPTFSYPIAQATVSVYFTFEVSRVIPKNVPVRVTFTVESLRSVVTPGEIIVNDEMLLRVLYAKLAVFQQVCF